jgi:zinc finger-like protein
MLTLLPAALCLLPSALPLPAPRLQRKAYLRQNIMASHYIVSQQRRMHSSSQGSQGSSAAATPTALAVAGLRDGLILQPTRQHKQGQQQAQAGGVGGFDAAAAAPAQQQDKAGACVPVQQQQEQQPAAVGAQAPPLTVAAAPQQQQQRAPAVPRYHDAAAGVLGCKHYRRRCMLVAPCCDTPYVCRLCHDEAADHQVGGAPRHAVLCCGALCLSSVLCRPVEH